MFTDYHVHTEFSDDSDYLMEDVIKDAITMKMDEICFTDHVDYGIKKDWDEGPVEYLYGQPQVNVDYPKYFKEIESLRKKYPEIIIRQGMEFGVQVHTIPRYQKLYERYDFDFILYIKLIIKNFGHKTIKKENHNKNIWKVIIKKC